MELHESLRQLASDHGESLFTEADAFRGALDDYLDEGSASTGTINLLTDAVRLGALQGMLSMLDSGAGVDDAVETAGQRLSRDRGSADVAGSQWACAVLGYALGRIPQSLATRLRPDALTAEPPTPPAAPPAQQRPSADPPAPGGWPGGGGVTTPSQQPAQPGQPRQPDQQSPTQQWPAPAGSHQPTQHHPAQHQSGQHAAGQYGGQGSPYGFSGGPGGPGWAAPAPKKSRTGLIVGAIAAAVVLAVVGVVGIVALAGGDEDDPATGEDTATSETTTDGSETTSTATTDPSLTLQGGGYHYTFPNDEWRDLTAETDDPTGTIDSIAAPGEQLNTAQGNVLVEKSSAYGQSDVNELADQWKTVLSNSTGATPSDIEPRQIGGKDAVGVELKWTNDNGFEVHQIAYLVVSGDEQYSITGSFRQGDEEFEQIFHDVLETWVWDE